MNYITIYHGWIPTNQINEPYIVVKLLQKPEKGQEHY